LTLREDGTYVQQFAEKNQPPRVINTGRWELRQGDFWQGQFLNLFDPVIVDVFRRRSDAQTDGSGTSTLLADALRTTLALANGAGTVQTQYTFEPFGATTLSGATSTSTAQFTGRDNDGTGLYYYRARFYHPGLQRFISEDPLGFGGGLNAFAYAGNADDVPGPTRALARNSTVANGLLALVLASCQQRRRRRSRCGRPSARSRDDLGRSAETSRKGRRHRKATPGTG
jgi:RHS repeat-associated protein